MLSEIALWDKNFERLRRHMAEELSFELGTHNRLHPWVTEQRHAGMRGNLDAARRQRLLAIGFLFTIDADALAAQTWELHFSRLGNILSQDPGFSPGRYGATRRMHRWVQRQNEHIRAGTLDASRFDRLQNLAPHLFRKRRRRTGVAKPTSDAT